MKVRWQGSKSRRRQVTPLGQVTPLDQGLRLRTNERESTNDYERRRHNISLAHPTYQGLRLQRSRECSRRAGHLRAGRWVVSLDQFHGFFETLVMTDDGIEWAYEPIAALHRDLVPKFKFNGSYAPSIPDPSLVHSNILRSI